MKKPAFIFIITCLFYGINFSSLSAQQHYSATKENYIQIAQEIHASHNSYNFVSLEEITAFLGSQLNLTNNETGHYPYLLLTGFNGDAAMFRWHAPPAYDYFQFAYLSLYDGNHFHSFQDTTSIYCPIPEYKFTLFTLTGIDGEAQSHLDIIIVDRDIFFGNTREATAAVWPSSNDFSATAQPNPCQEDFQLRFELPLASEVHISLVNTGTGRLVQQIPLQYHPAGQHSRKILVRDIPKGHYQCLIQTNYGRKSIPFVKL